MTFKLTGKYTQDRHVIKIILMLFGNLTVSTLKNLNHGSRTVPSSIYIFPDVLSFGCHLGGCNPPGDDLQIPHSNEKDNTMISDTQKNGNTISLLNDLYLSLFVLRHNNPDEIKRTREKSLNLIIKIRESINSGCK
ncbi:MAG: hypothetical protein KKG99_17455 [Bacteroidetes bacterium]|nr:hypothetical protein [Bacteroidota bacterium]